MVVAIDEPRAQQCAAKGEFEQHAQRMVEVKLAAMEARLTAARSTEVVAVPPGLPTA